MKWLQGNDPKALGQKMGDCISTKCTVVFLKRTKVCSGTYLQPAQRLWAEVFFLLYLCMHSGLAPHSHGLRVKACRQTGEEAQWQAMIVVLTTGRKSWYVRREWHNVNKCLGLISWLCFSGFKDRASDEGKMVFYKYSDCSSFMCLFYPFPTLMYVTSRFALTIVKLEILNLNTQSCYWFRHTALINNLQN